MPPPVTTPFTSSGSYTPPPWTVQIDVIGVGSGGGGSGGDTAFGATGNGGGAGNWSTTTLLVGQVSFPVTVTINAGGVGGAKSGGAGGNGGACTFGSYLSASGGAGATGTGGSATGLSPGNHSYNGVTYTGGGTAAQNAPGSAPGGGGGGGSGGFFGGGNPGQPGATGQIWVVAYTWVPVNNIQQAVKRAIYI